MAGPVVDGLHAAHVTRFMASNHAVGYQCHRQAGVVASSIGIPVAEVHRRSGLIHPALMWRGTIAALHSSGSRERPRQGKLGYVLSRLATK